MSVTFLQECLFSLRSCFNPRRPAGAKSSSGYAVCLRSYTRATRIRAKTTVSAATHTPVNCVQRRRTQYVISLYGTKYARSYCKQFYVENAMFAAGLVSAPLPHGFLAHFRVTSAILLGNPMPRIVRSTIQVHLRT